MIEINSIEEMEKYKRVEKHGAADYVFYEFIENDNLADIQINCKFVPTKDKFLSLLLDADDLENDEKLFEEEILEDDKNLFDESEESEEIDDVDFNLYIVRCRDICFAEDCGFDYLEARNVEIKTKAGIENVKSTGDIKAEDLQCLNINCKSIRAESVSCENLVAEESVLVNQLCVDHIEGYKRMEVNELIINGCILNNVASTSNDD